MKICLTLAACLALSACVPMVHSYYKTEYPGAEHFGEDCTGSAGAPSIAYFPYKGIFMSVDVRKRQHSIIIGFHIPEGKSIQLLGHSITISYDTAGRVTKAELKPTDRQFGPYEFWMVPSPFGKEDYFGMLAGETKIKRFLLAPNVASHKTYLFEASMDIKAKTGTIRFPEVMINDKIYKGPVVHYKKSNSFELSPLNC